MAAPKAKEKILRLRSSDNQEFEVNESVAIQSVKLKKMIEDDCADESIPLPAVTSHILFKVIEYCNKHAEPTGPGDAVGATNKSAEDWLKIFVNADQDSLIDLMLAANYLDIKGLLNLTRQTLTDMIKGNMPEGRVRIPEKSSTSSTSALTTTMSSKKKEMDAKLDCYLAQMEGTFIEFLNGFADHGEECRMLGHHPDLPPLEIVNHPVDNAGMSQKVDMLLSKVDVIEKQLKSFMSEYQKFDKSLVQNKNSLEQILLARLREIEDCICSKQNAVLDTLTSIASISRQIENSMHASHNDLVETLKSRFRQMEDSIQEKHNKVVDNLTALTSRLRQMEESVRVKQNNLLETLSARAGQTEERLIAIEKDNQDMHIEVTSKLDAIMQLLQKPGNT